jgi:hypothetical protein
MASLVSLHNVVKRYTRGKQTIEVLHQLDLEVPTGQFLALMSPSGSGKTTGAAERGFHVIVPVDCMPARSAYAEQNVVWGIANDPEFAPPRAFGGGPPRGYATLTSSDMIHFG